MHPFLILLLVWLANAPVTYFLARHDLRDTEGQWKRIDRLVCAGMSLLYGPFGPITFVLVTAFEKLCKTDWANKKVRW